VALIVAGREVSVNLGDYDGWVPEMFLKPDGADQGLGKGLGVSHIALFAAGFRHDYRPQAGPVQGRAGGSRRFLCLATALGIRLTLRSKCRGVQASAGVVEGI